VGLSRPVTAVSSHCAKQNTAIVGLAATVVVYQERHGLDMALERDNTAERLARIDKLMAEIKPTATHTVMKAKPEPSFDADAFLRSAGAWKTIVTPVGMGVQPAESSLHGRGRRN
jgi:hypothetical protein